MTVIECYNKIGGDYDNAMGRFKSEALIKRFLPMFLNDPSFNELTEALENGDVQTAFRAAHTLKGVCANLSLAKLCASASEITELLRAENLNDAKDFYPVVKEDYDLTFKAIECFKAEL